MDPAAQDAKNESVEAILAAARLKADSGADGKQKKVIVTGCLAQRYSEDLATEMPEAGPPSYWSPHFGTQRDQ